MSTSPSVSTSKRICGVLAEFKDVDLVCHAAHAVVEAGYKKFDVYSPFPIHGIDRIMKIKDSPLAWIVLVCGLVGGAFGFLLQTWVAITAYPVVISGKPLFSWQAFIPVTFELTILFSAFGAVFGMLALNRLPKHYNPIFQSTFFERATDDRFFVGIDASDSRFDVEKVKTLLKGVHAVHVEELYE